MAKKKMTEQEVRAAQETYQNAMSEFATVLKTTPMKRTEFEAAGKTWVMPEVKVPRGLVKPFLNKGNTDIGEFATIYAELWDREVAKIEGLEEVLDEMDWEEWDKLFNEWTSLVVEKMEKLEKKYLQ